jgi:hypothetical protein
MLLIANASSRRELTTLYYEDGKTEGLTGKLYNFKKASTNTKLSQPSGGDDLYYEADTLVIAFRRYLLHKRPYYI